MKRYILISVVCMGFCLNKVNAQVAINTTGANPDASAGLDVNFTDKGLLIPRVALTQTSSALPITSPDTSLLVYNKANVSDVTPGYYYWNGSAWVRFATGSGSVGWLLTGNAGTVDGTNFLGTTDNIPLTFKVNNQRAGRISSDVTLGEVFYGYQTGNVNTGNRNTFMGYQAGTSNTSGSYNTALGYLALYQNTTGEYNTAIGQQTLRNNNGNRNTAVGMEALIYNISGNYNTSVGTFSTYNNNTGNCNTAVGYYSLYGTTATGNTSLGYQAGDANTSGTYNTFIGYDADANVGTYTNSTAIGNGTTITASNQVVIGNTNITGLKIGGGSLGTSSNSANLYYDPSTGIVYRSTAVAGGSGWLLTGNASTIDGTNFIGTTDNVPFNFKINNTKAGRIATNQTFLGYMSGNSATGIDNSYFGVESGYSTTTATENTFIGRRAGYFLQTGSSNVAIGFNALYCYGGAGGGPFPGGNGNVAIGKWAMFNPTSGNNNVAVGFSTYSLPHTGSCNVFIGYYADANTGVNPNYATGIGSYSTVDVDYATAIGYRAYANQANSLILGSINGVNSATVTAKVGIGTYTPQATLHVVSPNTTINEVTMRIGPVGGGSSITSIPSVLDFWSTFDNMSSDQGPRRTASIKVGYIGGVWGNEYLSIHVGNATDAANLPDERLRIVATGAGNNLTAGGSWGTLSDKRIKSDIEILHYGLKEIMQLKPVEYLFHDSHGFDYIPEKISTEGVHDVGFVAQEVYNVIPEIVYKPKNPEKELWGMMYEKITPVLVKAIQEQQKLIENQQSVINDLKTQMVQQQKEIDELKNNSGK